MRKLILLSLFFMSVNFHAQNSIAVKKEISQKFTEKDIKIDTDSVATKKFETNFKKKYKDKEFDYKEVVPEKSLRQRIYEWFAKWYQKTFGISDYKTSTNYVEYTFKTLAVLTILFVIYIIARMVLNKEGKWIFGDASSKKVINYDNIEQNLKNVDFEKLISETKKSGDNRLVIRYYYLWILKKMSDKNIIDWNVEKTNSDYIYEIKDKQLREDFSYISYLYNNIWYGEYELEQEAYEKAEHIFNKTIQSL